MKSKLQYNFKTDVNITNYLQGTVLLFYGGLWFIVLNAAFNNIPVISWR